MKVQFTRKNCLFFGILFFVQVCIILCGIGVDSHSVLFGTDNIIGSLASGMGLVRVDASWRSYFALISFCVVMYLVGVSIVYEMQLAKKNNEKLFTRKWMPVYLLTFLVGFLIWSAIALLAQLPLDQEVLQGTIIFWGVSLLMGLLTTLVLGLLIFNVVYVFLNIKNIDKPFRFSLFAKRETEEEIRKKKFLEENALLYNKEIVFPGLCTIDSEESTKEKEETIDSDYTLEKLVEDFRNYLAKEEKLYFGIEKLRGFVAGLSVSRLLILEGLSGTGKSSLARYFSTFIGEKSYFESVQASWHDRTALLGFYNDFAKKYNETEFLKRLYRMNYRTEDVNIMVLDEVNISRVEYYFADFLSVMEYPMEDWKLKIMELPQGFEAPTMLKDGFVAIPKNTWFIGTANKDESTYAITDKVYDRAIIISFDDRNTPFEIDESVKPIHLSYPGLQRLFDQARNNEDYNLSQEDIEKFLHIAEFVYDTFDIAFGNRIWNQIVNMVPVYVALGGSKEEALDFMFARKYLHKLDGRFEDFVKQGLIDLQGLIERTYGEDSFKETHQIIANMLRKL